MAWCVRAGCLFRTTTTERDLVACAPVSEAWEEQQAKLPTATTPDAGERGVKRERSTGKPFQRVGDEWNEKIIDGRGAPAIHSAHLTVTRSC